MNINIFEKTKENHIASSEQSSLPDEHALQIKQKIDARKNKQKKVKLILAGLVALIIFLSALTAYSQYKLHILTKEEAGLTNASSTPQTGEEVLGALGRHILLPSGTPQIAEVQDAARLRETQAFFKDAQNGDIVVVYETTIFLYRPSQDIVIAAGDISGAGQVAP